MPSRPGPARFAAHDLDIADPAAFATAAAQRWDSTNAVSPGIIQTPMHAPETYDGLAGLHPVGRMGTISDIVDGVLYLEHAPFVTGEILHIDGGQSAGH